MIRPEKLINALYAMQGVAIQARFIALTKPLDEKEKLVKLLDFLDDAPRMIANTTDETDKFRLRLKNLAERYNYWVDLQRFDDPVPEKW